MVLFVAMLAISFPVNITDMIKLPVHTNNIIVDTDLYNLLKTQRLINKIDLVFPKYLDIIGDNTERQFWRMRRLYDRLKLFLERDDKGKLRRQRWRRRAKKYLAAPSPSPEPENYMESSNLNQEAEDYNPDLFWIKDD